LMACPEAAGLAVSLLRHRSAAPDTPAPGAECFSTVAPPTTTMERNGGIDQLATKVSQTLERALLIQPSQS